jgi:hypothetical protein
MASRNHTAPGQAAGYTYQFERALLHLAESEKGSVIGIETMDDITVLGQDSRLLILEQDKSAISNRDVLGNTSKDLWNTLAIWLMAIENEDIDFQTLRLFLVTNKEVNGELAQDIGKAKSESEIYSCIAMQGESAKHAGNVLQHTDTELHDLISCIELFDSKKNSAGAKLYETVISKLHIPESLPSTDIIEKLLGWIVTSSLEAWRSNQPAWIKRGAFDIRLQSLLRDYSSALPIPPASFLPSVPKDIITIASQYNYIKQIEWLNRSNDESELILDALNDYNRAVAARTRLYQEGNIDRADIDNFEDRLIEKWKNLKRRNGKDLDRKNSTYDIAACKAGYSTYLDCMDHKDTLKGQTVEEPYFSKGHFHKLSDEWKLGWHPDYISIMRNKAKALK